MPWSVVVRKLTCRNADFERLCFAGLEFNTLEAAQGSDWLIDLAFVQVRVDLGNFGAGAVSGIPHLEGNRNFGGGTPSGTLNRELAELESRIAESEAKCVERNSLEVLI